MKIKAIATVQWEIELPENLDYSKVAKDTLSSILPKNFSIDLLKVKTPPIRTEVLGQFTLDEVMPFVRKTSERIEFKVGDQSYFVKMNSSRYFVFQKSHVCIACGLEGKVFLLEKHPHSIPPHFNLYGEEKGNLVLMTKDHIIPRAKNGSEKLENFVTCCHICNNLKADYDLTYDQVSEVRKVFDANQEASRKARSKAIRDARDALVKKTGT